MEEPARKWSWVPGQDKIRQRKAESKRASSQLEVAGVAALRLHIKSSKAFCAATWSKIALSAGVDHLARALREEDCHGS